MMFFTKTFLNKLYVWLISVVAVACATPPNQPQEKKDTTTIQDSVVLPNAGKSLNIPKEMPIREFDPQSDSVIQARVVDASEKK